MRRREGFTLLEVMIAIFVLGTVVGALLQMMQAHLSRLADARHELDAARLAELRLREIQSTSADGILPDLGRTEGVFDPPYDYLQWELVVEEAAVPLPDDLAGSPPPSTIFSLGGPVPGQTEPLEPSLRRVSMRVFPEQVQDPESFTPYVLYVVQPPDEEALNELAGPEDEELDETLEQEEEE